MRLFARLFRLVWGGEVDRPLRPVLAVGLVGSIAGSCVWSFVGIWAIRRLGAGQTTLGLIFLASALVGIGAGYLGGHLSDHVGRRPLILVAWAGQAGLLLCFLAARGNEVAGLGLICLGGLFFQLGSAADQPMIADLVPPARHEAGYAAVRGREQPRDHDRPAARRSAARGRELARPLRWRRSRLVQRASCSRSASCRAAARTPLPSRRPGAPCG